MSFIDRVSHYNQFLSEKGREDLAGAVRAYRKQYGEKWLAEFKKANPGLFEIVDMIANYEVPAAIERIREMANTWIDEEPNETAWEKLQRVGLRAGADVFIREATPAIAKLHAALRAEIDRPRI